MPEQQFKTLPPLIIVMTEQSMITSFGGPLQVPTLRISCLSTYSPPPPRHALMVKLLLCGVALCCCVAIKINCARESFAINFYFFSLFIQFSELPHSLDIDFPIFTGRCSIDAHVSTHLYAHVRAHTYTKRFSWDFQGRCELIM